MFGAKVFRALLSSASTFNTVQTMNSEQQPLEKDKSSLMIGGFVFVGLLMLGIGVGHLTGNLVAGRKIGLGLGFLAMAGVYYKMK